MSEKQEENEEHLQPGYRFYPTEEEIVSFYLRNQLAGKVPEKHRVIPVFNVYDTEPWELPKFAGELCRGESEQWFFFVPRQEREARGGRPSRTTAAGYWKATGSPVHVYSSDSRVIGLKKTMVFYKGRAPTGTKTKWKMNEYRAIQEIANPSPPSIVPKLRGEFSLCRVYVVLGNFQTFDRRPLEVVTGAQQCLKNIGPMRFSDQKLKQLTEKTKTSSQETSRLVPGMARQSLYYEGSSSNWEIIDEQEQVEEYLWKWEQFDWP